MRAADALAAADTPVRASAPVQLLGVGLWLAMLVGHEHAVLSETVPAHDGPLSHGIAVAAALLALAGWLPRRARWWLLALSGGLLSAALVFDRASLLYFGQPAGIEMSVALHQIWAVRGSANLLVSPLEALYPLSFLAFAALASGRDAPRRRRRTRIARVAAMLALASSSPVLSLAAAEMEPPRNAVEFQRPGLRFAREHGLLLYHAWDVVDAARRAVREPVEDEDVRAAIAAHLAARAQLNATPSPLFGIARGRSVILVQLEAVQGFVQGLAVPGGVVSPVLNRLAAQGLSPRVCLDPTGIGRTSDAEFSVLTGLLPHPRRPVAFTHAGNRWVTLPRQLAAAGYATAALHANDPSFWNRAVAHPAYGIERLHFRSSFPDEPSLAWGLADEVFFQHGARLLASLPEPFFALVVSLSSHHPFRVVPQHMSRWPTGLPDDSMGAHYLRLVRYTDAALGELLDGLRRSGLLERSLLVVYGDHVAGLDEPSRRELSALVGSDLDAVGEHRVPLVIAVPGEEEALAPHRAELAGRIASLHDVAPTVLHLLGLPVPVGFEGTHLLVPDAARDPLPAVDGRGFAAGGALHEAGAPGLLEEAALAWSRLALAQDVIELDAQGAPIPPGTPRDAESAHELLRRVYLAPDEGPPPWRASREGVEPLPDGQLLVPSIPSLLDGTSLALQLENPGGGEARYALRGFDPAGNEVFAQHGRLAGGAAETIVLGQRGPQADPLRSAAPRPPAPGERTGATHALLDAPAPLVARASVRGAFAHAPQPLPAATARRTVLEGSTEGVDRATLLVLNPGPTPARVTLELFLDGERRLVRELEVAARGMHPELLSLAEWSCPLQLVVDGDPVAVHWVRWDDADRPYR